MSEQQQQRGEVSTESFFTTTPERYNATFFHIYGIEADASNPFRLMINGVAEFKSDVSLDGVIVNVNLQEPKVAAEHIIRFCVSAPAMGQLGKTQDKRFNLSYNGKHFLIAPNENGDIMIVQSKKDNFDDLGFSGATPYATKNEGMYEQPQILSSTTTNDAPASTTVETPAVNVQTPVKKKTVLDPNFHMSSPTTPQTEETVYDESILNKDGQDRLAKLKEYREKGILTKKDYEKRMKELFDKFAKDTGKNPVLGTKPVAAATTTPVKTTTTVTPTTSTTPVKAPVSTTTTAAPKSTPVNTQNLNAKDQEDLSKLERLYNSGILTKDEYEQKRDQVLANAVPVTQPTTQTIATKPKTSTPEANLTADQQEQLTKLKKFLDMGILTQDEYNQKRDLVIASAQSAPPATQATTTTLTADQKEQLAKLEKFVGMGVLTQEEFEQKKKMVLGGTSAPSSAPAPSTTAEPKKTVPVYVNNQKHEPAHKTSTQLVIHISNVKASAEKPFQLLLNGQTVMYQSTEEISPNKEVAVRGDIPHMSDQELTVSITIKVPESGVDTSKEFNLTKDGRFVQIGFTSDNQLSIKQQPAEVFDPLVAPPKPEPQPVRAAGKTDIMLKFRGLKASKEQPFEIYYMDRLLFSSIEDMPDRQIGCVTGQILKERRSNAQTDEEHEVTLRIKCPKIGVEEATSTLNLSRDGAKLYVEVSGDNLIVKQSANDEEFETEFRFVDLLITRADTADLNDKDFEMLQKLKALFDAGVLTDEEYQKKKDSILNK